MTLALAALNKIVDKILAHRPKRKTKKVRKAKTAHSKKSKPERGSA